MSWDKNIKNYYDNKKKTTAIEEPKGLEDLIEGIMGEMSDVLNKSWQSSIKWQVIKEDEEENPNIKAEKAQQFVLSLPKYTPTEAWGDPTSMERKQIEKIFNTVGGGATIEEKLTFLNDTIYNPRGTIGTRGGTRRILGTLIILESLTAVIRSFNEASAGFVFEGFLAALFRGRQEAGRTEKGNLPIEDLIAFSQVGEDSTGTPVSLKLLNQTTDVEGSYTNLVDALFDDWADTGMTYIVARKDGEQMSLEQFRLTSDNFIDAIATIPGTEKLKTSGEALFAGKDGSSAEQMIAKIKAAEEDEEKYNLLKQTKGYSRRGKPADDDSKGDLRFDDWKRAFEEPALWGAPNTTEKFEKYFAQGLRVGDTLLRLWKENTDESLDPKVLYFVKNTHEYFKALGGIDGTKDKEGRETDRPAWMRALFATRKQLGSGTYAKTFIYPLLSQRDEINDVDMFFEKMLDIAAPLSGEQVAEATSPWTVAENRIMWEEVKSEMALLTENKGGTQWSISPPQLAAIDGVEYSVLGTLPYNSAAVNKVAERYIDLLQGNLTELFTQVKNLSDNVNDYFFTEKRTTAIGKGSDAVDNATEAGKKIKSEVDAEKKKKKK